MSVWLHLSLGCSMYIFRVLHVYIQGVCHTFCYLLHFLEREHGPLRTLNKIFLLCYFPPQHEQVSVPWFTLKTEVCWHAIYYGKCKEECYWCCAVRGLYLSTARHDRWARLSTSKRGVRVVQRRNPSFLSTSRTARALNHRDRNRTAAYLCVGPWRQALSPSPHLHFVAPAKLCHPKSPTNLPPYGRQGSEGDGGGMVEPHGAICCGRAHGGGEGWASSLHFPPTSNPTPCTSFIQTLHPLSPVSPPTPSKKKNRNEESLSGWIYELPWSPWQPLATLHWGGAGKMGREQISQGRGGIVVLVFRVSANPSNCWVLIKRKR